jgi:Glycerophosphoryl diester phosphodiesterase
MQDAVVLSSFDHAQLSRIGTLAPGVRTAVLSSDRLYRPAEYLARLGASAYNPGCYGDYDTVGFGAVTGQLDHETIAEVRAAGYDVYVWTENDPERMRRLIEAGVSGIFTDYPNRLRALLDIRGGKVVSAQSSKSD